MWFSRLVSLQMHCTILNNSSHRKLSDSRITIALDGDSHSEGLEVPERCRLWVLYYAYSASSST